MAPTAVHDTTPDAPIDPSDLSDLKAKLRASSQTPSIPLPPDNALRRYQKAGIDLSNGYPSWPPKIEFAQDVPQLRTGREYVDPGTRADKEKKALFGAAKKVVKLTPNLGTEIIGLQLKDLTDQQKNELALLVAERSVVFFRDQDISPQQQQALGLYLGGGEVERRTQAPTVPGVSGVSLIWEDARTDYIRLNRSYRVPYGGGQFGWHSDLAHEVYPPGYTHLHQDTVPEVGGDTLWASGYAAYDKLSPTFQKMLDGLNGIYRSSYVYKDAENPDADKKFITQVHPMVRTHPVTGWKALWINRAMTIGIEGLDKPESDAILNYLFGIFERSTDIQIRWHWTPGTSVIWDNRTTIHTVSYDYHGERHGTRVASLAEKPFYDPESKSRAAALQLDGWVGTKDY